MFETTWGTQNDAGEGTAKILQKQQTKRKMS